MKKLKSAKTRLLIISIGAPIALAISLLLIVGATVLSFLVS